MITIACDWGADLSIGPTGDIKMTAVLASVQQRIIRRLLTNQGDYIWHTNYGAGLGSYVGDPYAQTAIKGNILNQLQLEALVAMTPAPTIQTNRSLTGPFSAMSVTVRYWVADSFTANSIVLEVGV
jgi:hypothetical protein